MLMTAFIPLFFYITSLLIVFMFSVELSAPWHWRSHSCSVDGTMVRSLTLNSGPNRYSEGVIRSPALASATDVETYLTPIPSNPNSYVVSTEIRPNQLKPEVLYRVNLDQFSLLIQGYLAALSKSVLQNFIGATCKSCLWNLPLMSVLSTFQ